MADQDTLLLRLQRAEQKLFTWEWARDNAIRTGLSK